jgi:hypothetical protein
VTCIIDPDFAEIDEPIITLRMTKTQAETVSWAMSDLLCWCRGYMAGIGDETQHAPMGVAEVRELRIALNKAIQKGQDT